MKLGVVYSLFNCETDISCENLLRPKSSFMISSTHFNKKIFFYSHHQSCTLTEKFSILYFFGGH